MIYALAITYIAGVCAWISGALFFDLSGRIVPNLGSTGRLQRYKRRRWVAWALVVIWWTICIAISSVIDSISVEAILATCLLAAFLVWWLQLKPSHDRDWDPHFAVLPHIEYDGDQLIISNIRNARYPSVGESDLRFETRSYDLESLVAVDALIIFWGSRWICHPMAIFDFGDERNLCFSIEVRYKVGDQFSILPSLYRQSELMYVVADEYDAITRRVRYFENEIDCYLYRLQVDQIFARGLLDEYVAATNQIAERPKWYNAITSNCTTEIFANRREKVPFDWRMLLNGQFDKLLYDKGLLVSHLPFSELRKSSRINDAVKLATEDGFATTIRRGLPGCGSALVLTT